MYRLQKRKKSKVRKQKNIIGRRPWKAEARTGHTVSKREVEWKVSKVPMDIRDYMV